jgi:hypothetical protein
MLVSRLFKSGRPPGLAAVKLVEDMMVHILTTYFTVDSLQKLNFNKYLDWNKDTVDERFPAQDLLMYYILLQHIATAHATELSGYKSASTPLPPICHCYDLLCLHIHISISVH